MVGLPVRILSFVATEMCTYYNVIELSSRIQCATNVSTFIQVLDRSLFIAWTILAALEGVAKNDRGCVLSLFNPAV